MTATTRVVVPRQRLVPWASGVLNLPADATDAQRRARLFAAVREADFIPSSDVEQAIAVLGQSGDELMLNDSGWRALADAERDDARREIEAFAAKFFDLALGPRREQWLALRNRYGYLLAWRRRLASLEPGLGVMLPTDQRGGRVGQFVEHVRQTFALPADQRIRRDAEFLRKARAQKGRWRATADHLAKTRSPVAELAPYLVREIAEEPIGQFEFSLKRVVREGVGSSGGVFIYVLAVLVVLVGLTVSFNGGSRQFNRNKSNISDDIVKQLPQDLLKVEVYNSPPPGATKTESALPFLYGRADKYDAYLYRGTTILVKKPAKAKPASKHH